MRTMASTYTKRDVDKMIDIYTENPCLEVVGKLANMFNRPRKSIISKLSKEGVYVTRGYRSKSGSIPITKLQLVRSIEDALDVKFPDLEKSPKATLQRLSDSVIEMAELLEDTLEELKHSSETKKVQDEIFEILGTTKA